jgi:hypothetical protein
LAFIGCPSAVPVAFAPLLLRVSPSAHCGWKKPPSQSHPSGCAGVKGKTPTAAPSRSALGAPPPDDQIYLKKGMSVVVCLEPPLRRRSHLTLRLLLLISPPASASLLPMALPASALPLNTGGRLFGSFMTPISVRSVRACFPLPPTVPAPLDVRADPPPVPSSPRAGCWSARPCAPPILRRLVQVFGWSRLSHLGIRGPIGGGLVEVLLRGVQVERLGGVS